VSEPARTSVRRILVALDASPSSLQALALAARVAAEAHADLEGLFIEDTDLLSFAELPFASVTGAHLGRSRRMDQGEIQRAIRLQAQRAREAMARATSAVQVRWSFRVVRGNVQRVLVDEASRVDMLSLGSIGVSWPRRRSGGSTARGAARGSACSVLIQIASSDAAAPVVALLHSEQGNERVLENAALAARASARPLIVMIPGSLDDPQRAAEQAKTVLASWQLPRVRVMPVSETAPRVLLTEARQLARGGVLVLGVNHPALASGQLDELIDRSSCSLLLLR